MSFLVHFIYKYLSWMTRIIIWENCMYVIGGHTLVGHWRSCNKELFSSMRRPMGNNPCHWRPEEERQREGVRGWRRIPVGPVTFLGLSSCCQPVLAKKGLVLLYQNLTSFFCLVFLCHIVLNPSKARWKQVTFIAVQKD